MKKAQIVENIVVNVIEIDPNNIPDWCADWPDVTDAGIGWTYSDGVFIEPPQPEVTPDA